jgi:hypothetical protein
MRAGVSAQTLAILLTLSGFLTLARSNNVDIIDRSPVKGIVPRQASASGSAGANANTTPAAASATPSQAATSQQAATSAAPASSAQPQQSSTPAQQSSTQQQQQSSQTPASSTNNNKPTNSASDSGIPTTVTSALVTTNPAGQVVTSLVVVADTRTPSAGPSQTAASSNSASGGSSVGTSTIIGLSVAGGVAVLCVIGFFVWKFTRKRIGAYDNSCVFSPRPHYDHRLVFLLELVF